MFKRYHSLCSICLLIVALGFNTPAISAKLKKPIHHTLPQIHHWTTKQVIQVYFIAEHSLPIVDIHLVFKAGSAYDGKLPGLAQLTNRLLIEGSKNLSQQQIAVKFDDMAAQYRTSVNRDMAVVTLRTLTTIPKTLVDSIELFGKVVTQASFLPKRIEQQKERQRSTLKEKMEQPSGVAAQAFYRDLYVDHPYSHDPLGHALTIDALTREHILQFYKNYYTARNVIICIVGDLSITQAHHVAQNLSSQFPIGQPITALHKAASTTDSQETFIDFPTNQTHMLIGEVGITPQEADFFPLLISNTILGNSNTMVSRMFNQIRNQQGLVYHVSSHFSLADYRGAFVIALQTRNQQAEYARKSLKQLLSTFVEQGPTKEELVAAKSYLINHWPLNFTDNASIANQLTQLAFYQYPIDFWENYNKNIQKVTLEQVKQATARHIHPDKLISVIVRAAPASTNRNTILNEH